MTSITTLDPKNLSNIYFASDASIPSNEYYVHPSISIANTTTDQDEHAPATDERIAHGRGVMVQHEISAGECLFVSPPTVTVGFSDMKTRYLEEGRGRLEDAAMELLQENMMGAIEEQNHATMNSFLVLMGSSITKKEEEINVTLDLLNAQVDTQIWSGEQLSKITETNMKNIILKNAFGPDFITYDKIQQQWEAAGLTNHSSSFYIPPHILGIYPLAAMINHSCTANAIRSFAHNGTMIVHASKTIPKGSEVKWSYIPPTQVFAERRRALKKRHGFFCKCERCLVEAKELRRDILPVTLQSALEEGMKWNGRLMDVVSGSNVDNSSKRQLCIAFMNLEDNVFASTSKSLSNEVKRHLRVGYTNLHFNYFNAVLLSATGTDKLKQAQKMVLASAMQLHFAFCASNNASTEHLSILHLCYELAIAIYSQSNDTQKTPNLQVKFWTETIKRIHMIRYGGMGSDLEAVRKCLVHTRTLLRQRNGFLKVNDNFL